MGVSPSPCHQEYTRLFSDISFLKITSTTGRISSTSSLSPNIFLSSLKFKTSKSSTARTVNGSLSLNVSDSPAITILELGPKYATSSFSSLNLGMNLPNTINPDSR
ncbi:hypothetical protein AX774_g3095 [Zancudomyces culisetae]|uniref:Uncharacterized protein n=1 Tax=Zancudomyces culisetae TaxID=1213189 RepID=A0A1R1PR26_ZANCU|nr:hypothetical protein AX774_g3095 [Zancudomyces culisetae]|eukprot:OMH83408.1 hypothetical protein AX774_g3095 [Zancudomyces culisetae]